MIRHVISLLLKLTVGIFHSNNCIFIIMSIYLETYLMKEPISKYLFTDDTDKKAPERLKSTFARCLRENVWRTQEFIDLAPEDSLKDANGYPMDIGTHSGRKCPAEYATNCGAHSNETEIRGRWKGAKGGRVVFRYINVQQLFEDAKVAALLCLGGAVMYVIKDGITAITNEWLFQHVVPHVRRRFRNDSRLCRVLGLSLLYICTGDNADVYVPPELRARVRRALAELGLDTDQPIKKVPLVVYRVEGVLNIDALVGGDAPGSGGNAGGGGDGIHGISKELVQTHLVRINRLEQSNVQNQVGTSAAISELRGYLGNQLKIVNNNVRAYGGTIQGALVRQRASNRGTTILSGESDTNQVGPLVEVTPARLSSNLRTLRALWNEYKFGIDGRKPAEHFSVQERTSSNSLKQKYWRRNHVWKTIARLVRGGHSVDRAIVLIQNAYGFKTSVSKIIELMIRDRRTLPGDSNPGLL